MLPSGRSASRLTVENGDSVDTFDPKAMTESSSGARFTATNARAPAEASASGLPRMDCERSISVAIALTLPRFCAWKPTTGVPFSHSAGLPPPFGV